MGKLHFDHFVLRVVLFSLILLPPVSIIPGLPALRLDDLVLLGWLLLVVTAGAGHGVDWRGSGRIWMLGLLVFLFPISVMNGLFYGYETSFGDFNQLVRFAKYIAIYLLAFQVFYKSDPDSAEKLFRFVLVCGFFLFLIAVSQYMDFFGLNQYYIRTVAPTQYHTLVNDYPNPRPVGMLGNPNELGFLFVLLAQLSFFLIFYYQKKRFFFPLVVFFLGILITMSRTSFFSFLFGIFLFVFVYLIYLQFSRKLKLGLFFFGIFGVLLSIAVMPPVYEAFTWRIEKVFHLSTEKSYQSRLDNWSENIAIIKKHPILGVGPLRRASFEHAADNEWLLMLRSYGIFGVGMMILLCSWGVFRPGDILAKAFQAGLAGASFVYMIPLAVFHSLSLFPLLLFLLAFIDTRLSIPGNTGRKYVFVPEEK